MQIPGNFSPSQEALSEGANKHDHLRWMVIHVVLALDIFGVHEDIFPSIMFQIYMRTRQRTWNKGGMEVSYTNTLNFHNVLYKEINLVKYFIACG
jgi:hypothetical protein